MLEATLTLADQTEGMGRSTPVTKEDLPSQLYRAIARAIVTGRYRPGAKLVTQALAREYGVSVTPVRDALKRLASEGLVRIEPRVGTTVARISLTDIRDLYEIRELIETFAVQKHFDAATLLEMRRCTSNMVAFDEERLYNDFDLYWEYSAEDARFHRLIVEEAENTRLSEFYASLHTHWLIAPVLFGSRTPGRAAGQRDEHLEIISALEEKDTRRATWAVHHHLRTTLTVLERNWPAPSGTAATTPEGGFVDAH